MIEPSEVVYMAKRKSLGTTTWQGSAVNLLTKTH